MQGKNLGVGIVHALKRVAFFWQHHHASTAVYGAFQPSFQMLESSQAGFLIPYSWIHPDLVVFSPQRNE